MKKQCSNCHGFQPAKKGFFGGEISYCRVAATLVNHWNDDYSDVAVSANHCCWRFDPKMRVYALAYC